MKFEKDNKYINYALIIDNKHPFVYETKNKTVYLNVAKNYNEEAVNTFLSNKFEFFYKMINDPEFKRFYGKKVVHYLGKTYIAKTKKANKNDMVIKGYTLTLYCKNDTLSQQRAIYRKYLKKAVEQTLVKLYYDAEYDFKEIKIPKIVVKGLRKEKYFGMNAGDVIYLENDLGRYDEKYIKAVLYHELCHCFILEHNDAFYNLLDEKLENGCALDKEIDEIVYEDEF